MVTAWCMWCVCAEQTCFAKSIIADSMRVTPPRLVAKQTCRNSGLSLVIFEGIALDDDRSDGRVGGMEWCGEG